MQVGRLVRPIAFGMVCVLAGAASAIGDDVPFASPPPAMPGQPDGHVIASLGDLMGFVQMRHIKLWYAAKAKNWGLANYEIDQLNDTLSRAATRYMNIPVEFIMQAGKPLGDLRDAANAKDSAKFSRSYAELTAACNACHTGGGVGFIHIDVPTSSPYTDQVYELSKP